ncbi:MAG: glycosyltransferase family 2 protein [Candidatus Cloacimonadaceae bacterium]|jgi:cellulose synthase/poly-beta-1,6-N-acetylglucosamine synthase-like glycosyltransferase|nr:glycosyltransferase family 2 protein [Candidatus Cloacimonadota bacterium]MDY0127827.1 glycosyltransferase family 2 protein [Candidatus Cloacimonadaceae bacterium]MCB5254847.1 glycosyltransferase family 2 protein [Candidatus Cloacimonadota bacterium]MCK9177904.1 glycosyltransferase family 2 protein [Candidatus Cloacimonadota bacterium]MCK9242948.1 glycosyltransferase family 2 protein [Candidatus Cloacimonadota bacterium]
MIIALVLFWVSWSILAYHLVGYGAILYVISRFKKTKSLDDTAITSYPRIIALCAAYNEEKEIEAKILSFLALDYPKDRIKMIVISDDSTDKTNEIVSKYTTDSNIELIIQKPRRGKQSAHNMVLPLLDCDYVLSTDANSIFAPDAVMLLVKKMLSDPKLGLVSGELRLIKAGDMQSGEGLYWRYESFLKKMDSEFKSIIGANGSIFLIRRELFTEVDPQSVDDFERTLIVLKKGYLAAYEPRAIVTEEETEKASQEISRKIRIITQQWHAMHRNKALLNPFRFPKISFILISHKLIRWLLFVFVITGFVSSAFLLGIWLYKLAFILQIIFYGLGLIGLALQHTGIHFPFTGVATYFVAMVYSSAVALKNYFTNKNFGMWKPIR